MKIFPLFFKFLIIILLPFVNGCSSGVMKLGNVETKEVVDINLIPKNQNRIDKIIQPTIWGRDVVTQVETGPIWNSVFIGTESSKTSFNILSAFVEVELGYSATYIYRIKGQVSCKGTIYAVEAQGRRSAAWALESAINQSVSRGIINIAKQAEIISEACLQE